MLPVLFIWTYHVIKRIWQAKKITPGIIMNTNRRLELYLHGVFAVVMIVSIPVMYWRYNQPDQLVARLDGGKVIGILSDRLRAKGAEALPYLRKGLEDGINNYADQYNNYGKILIARRCASILSGLRDKGSIDLFIKGIMITPGSEYDFDTKGLRDNCAEALVGIGGAEVIEKFIKSLDSSGDETRDLILNSLDKLGRPIADYDEAIKSDPKDHKAYYNRAFIYDKKGYTDLAITGYTKVIKLNPAYVMAYHNRAYDYSKKGDYKAATADANMFLKLAPNHNLADGIGYRLKEWGYDADAEIKGNSQNAFAYLKRGNKYLQKGELKQAIADFNEAIKLDPKNPSAYINRGWTYSQQGNSEQALTDYNEAIKLDPKDAEAYTRRGRVYDEKGDSEKAIAEYTKAIALNSQYAWAYYSRGYAYFNKGNLDGAIADYTVVIKLNYGDVDIYYNRAVAYSKKGNLKPAIIDGEMFLNLAPNNPKAEEMKSLINQWKKQVK